MTAETPDTLIQVVPTTDRRPAIWPWLVKPLVTLLLYYSLDRLNRENEHEQRAYPAAAQVSESSDADASR